jgi:type II secretory pathway pseudopilin PulG
MKQSVLKLWQSRVGRGAIASGLSIALLGTLNTVAFSQSTTPSPVQTPTPPSSGDAVSQKLLGQWQGKLTPSDELGFIFTPEGKLYIMGPPQGVQAEGKRLAVEFQYRVNTAARPMEMDIISTSGEGTVKTIFEFTSDNQLRLQIEGTDYGKPRPTAFTFGTGVALLAKTSETASLPQNAQVVPLTPPASQPQPQPQPRTQSPPPAASQSPPAIAYGLESEAQKSMQQMNRAQISYRSNHRQFARTTRQLGISVKSQTENYRYRILSQGNLSRSVVMTAQAKKPGLRSYTSVVFRTKSPTGQDVTTATICETDNPSATPPANGKISQNPGDILACPSGSRELLL